MADLNDVYSARLLDLAADIPLSGAISAPDARASAHSKLCGSTVSVEIAVEDDRIVGFGQTVKACLLGQASASIVGREIIGTPFGEFRAIAAQMRVMLKENGPPPTGRWADLALLEPVRPYKARHASTLLIFDAVERAIDMVEGATQHAAKSTAVS
ncbi:MAG: iron-sulfur cluster assembly scaffold protein [Hyphomicrobiaceae bacterium]